jgi:serine/threonine-protein kinase
MEFLDGEPLDVRLESGPMNVEEAVPVLRAIGRALDAAHAAGIAHRDLKPANIFLVHEADGDLFPKLLDFGIAKLLGEATSLHKTRTGTPIGTPFYMSPEQCRGQGLDHRTDIYSFGCVAYEMLTGRVPFDGDNHLEILMKQIGEEPEPPSQRNPDVPPAIDDVIAWMMKKDPAERPPTLSAAIAALEQAAGIPPSRASYPVMTPPTGVAASRTPAHGVPVQRASSQDGRRASSQGDKRVSSRGPGALADTMTAAPPRRRWWIPAAIAVVALGGAGAFVMTRGDSEPARTPPAAPPPVATTPAPEKPAPAPTPVAEPAPVAAPPVTPAPPPVQTKADTKPKVVAKPRPKAKPAATQPAAPPPPGAPPADPYTRE